MVGCLKCAVYIGSLFQVNSSAYGPETVFLSKQVGQKLLADEKVITMSNFLGPA